MFWFPTWLPLNSWETLFIIWKEWTSKPPIWPSLTLLLGERGMPYYTLVSKEVWATHWTLTGMGAIEAIVTSVRFSSCWAVVVWKFSVLLGCPFLAWNDTLRTHSKDTRRLSSLRKPMRFYRVRTLALSHPTFYLLLIILSWPLILSGLFRPSFLPCPLFMMLPLPPMVKPCVKMEVPTFQVPEQPRWPRPLVDYFGHGGNNKPWFVKSTHTMKNM